MDFQFIFSEGRRGEFLGRRGKIVLAGFVGGEVASGMEIEEKDFGHGGVGRGGLGLAATGDFLEDLLDVGIGHIGFTEPVED